MQQKWQRERGWTAMGRKRSDRGRRDGKDIRVFKHQPTSSWLNCPSTFFQPTAVNVRAINRTAARPLQPRRDREGNSLNTGAISRQSIEPTAMLPSRGCYRCPRRLRVSHCGTVPDVPAATAEHVDATLGLAGHTAGKLRVLVTTPCYPSTRPATDL